MSSANPEEVSVVIERDGVRVEKSFEPDDFPVPAIAFVIRSERSGSVDVRMVDNVPEDVPAEDIGFHPKYGSEFWSVEGDHIVFEREFEAGEEYTTVYGLRASDTDDIERFLSEPELDTVDPPVGDEPEDSSQVVRDVIGGGAESGDDGGREAEGDDEGVEPLELNDPSSAGSTSVDASTTTSTDSEASDDDLEAAIAAAGDGEADESADTDAGTEGPHSDVEAAITEVGDEPAATADETTGAGVAAEDVAAILAEELRAGRVDQEDVETLRSALEPDRSTSTAARIEHLQTQVADIAAYTDALEEFLDEGGRAEDLLELHDEVRDLSETVEEMTGIREEVDRIDDRVTGLDDDVEEVRDTVSGVEDTVADLEDSVADLRESVEDLEETSEEVGEVGDRVEDLESDLDDIEGDLEDLARMRDQLSSVFGAAGGDEDE